MPQKHRKKIKFSITLSLEAAEAIERLRAKFQEEGKIEFSDSMVFERLIRETNIKGKG